MHELEHDRQNGGNFRGWCDFGRSGKSAWVRQVTSGDCTLLLSRAFDSIHSANRRKRSEAS